jgi:TraE protein
MNRSMFLSMLDAAHAKNRLLTFAFLVLLALNIVNTVSLQRARTLTQTVIVPVGGGSGMTVGHGKASDEYLRHMARYATQMVGTWTASSARPQLQELLSLFAPEVVGRAHAEFEKMSVQIERFPSISAVMRWQGDEALRMRPGLIQVSASKDRLVNGSVTETTPIHYCIEYRIDESRFWMLGLREIEGAGIDRCFLPVTAPKEGT